MTNNQPTTTDDNDEYYVVPVIESPWIHNGAGFCYDMACPCHENQDSIQELYQDEQDGLLSEADRERLYRGQTV